VLNKKNSPGTYWTTLVILTLHFRAFNCILFSFCALVRTVTYCRQLFSRLTDLLKDTRTPSQQALDKTPSQQALDIKPPSQQALTAESEGQPAADVQPDTTQPTEEIQHTIEPAPLAQSNLTLDGSMLELPSHQALVTDKNQVDDHDNISLPPPSPV